MAQKIKRNILKIKDPGSADSFHSHDSGSGSGGSPSHQGSRSPAQFHLAALAVSS